MHLHGSSHIEKGHLLYTCAPDIIKCLSNCGGYRDTVRSDQEETTSVPRRLSTDTHARVQLIGACKLCRLHSGCEDSIAQDWRSILTRDLSHQLPKTASLVVNKGPPGIRWFTCQGSEMALTGLAFDPNHVSGNYDFGLLTATEIILQLILLLCSTDAVTFSAGKTRGTVTTKRPDFRLEVSMPPVIERSTTDNVLWSSRCVPGGSRLRSRARSRCSRCLPNRVFPSFLDTRVFACSSFPHRLTFTMLRLPLLFRTVVTMETDTPYLKLYVFGNLLFCFV